jgi:hypothetical protein
VTTAQERFTSAVWLAEAELELSRGGAGRVSEEACEHWAQATEAAESQYCRETGMPPGCGWVPWIRHEPAGRHDSLMRLRARLFSGRAG